VLDKPEEELKGFRRGRARTDSETDKKAEKLETTPPSNDPALRGVPPVLGVAHPRGYGARPHLSPEAAAAFATYVDPARVRAAVNGRTLVYTVRWG